jgi:PAS domain S-box-containing protein
VASSGPVESTPTHLLIVHADDEVREHLARSLAGHYVVKTVGSPSEIPDPPPDLILSEQDFRPAGSAVPLVLLGLPNAEALGTPGSPPEIDDFLVPPFAPEKVRARVAFALARGRTGRAGDAERRRTAAALKESQERLTRLLEMTPIGIVELSIRGGIVFVNPAAETLLRLRRAELEGRYYLDPEVIRTTPDGQPIPPDQFPVARALLGETVSAYEMASVDPRNGQRVVVSVNAVPLRAEDGGITGVLAVFGDITARWLAEKELRKLATTLEERVAEAVAASEQSQAALLQAQKLETIGQLTGGVAHDFNNVLASIAGNLDLVRLGLTDERFDRLLESALKSVDRGAKLTEQLLAYARKQRLVPKAVDLNSIIRGLVEMLRRTLGGTIAVRTDLDPELWAALVDPTQMELVLLNLAINARDAMPDGGEIVIRTRNAAPDMADRPADLTLGEYVVLEVADTGTGMSKEVLARAFEPFFTTKEPGKGSGLGLSQIHGLAHQSGGTVRLRSQLGAGTEVRIYLPRTAETIHGEAAAEGADETPHQPAATILIVDDQQDVREVIMAQLESLGHRVLAASNGRAALDFFAPEAAPIDLLIADYAMPGMTGFELARTLRADRPELAIIMITGYADTDLVGKLDGLALLRKPYRIADLARHVDAALVSRSRSS